MKSASHCLLAACLAISTRAVVAQQRGEAPVRAVVSLMELSREPDSPAGSRLLPSPLRIPRPSPPVAPRPPKTSSPAAESEFAASTAPPPMLTGFPALLDNQTRVPPDTNGAAGPQHVVTMLNSEFQVQTRAGSVLARMTLDKFWSKLGPFNDTAFDPRILYDAAAQRWIVSSAVDGRRPTSALLIGASQTSDPTGTWFLYKIPAGPDQVWGDYPTLGFNGSWVVVSMNFFAAGAYVNTRVYAFPKADLYGGSRAPFVVFEDASGAFTPVTDLDNSSSRFLLLQAMTGFNGSGVIRVSDIQGPAGSEVFHPGVDTIGVPDQWADVSPGEVDFAPQQGGANIDAGDSRLQNCVLRNGSIWCAHTIYLPARGPVRSAVQWWQIKAGTLEVLQRGRVDDPSGAVFYAYPSIAVNRNGDVAVGYSRFGSGQYPSANFSFRAAGDPVNTLQPDTVIKSGEAPYGTGVPNSNRWGDYSSTVVDPVDDLSFWTLQQYAATPEPRTPGRWGTWWGRVEPLAAGAPACTYSVSPTRQFFQGVGGNGSVTVSAPAGCNWMAAPDASWIGVDSGYQGSGNAAVRFSVQSNPSTIDLRNASLTIAGQTVAILQSPALALPDLAITAISAPSSSPVNGLISLSATVRNQGGLRAGPFRLGFYIGTKPPGTFTGTSCAFFAGLDAGAATTCTGLVKLPATLGPGTYFVGAVADDRNALLEIDETNNSRAADPPLTILPDVKPNIPFTGVVSAASFRGGSVAPGEIVTIFGANIGPADLQTARLNTAGALDTTLGGARVWFDGVPAPLIYVRSDQASAVVPFAVAGKTSTNLEVEFNGARSNPVAIPVTATAPALFTYNQTGSGQGAILNEDGTANTPLQPATPGSVVVLYGTGAGLMDTPVADGQMLRPPLPKPLLPVTVRIGDREAEILYAGAAPGLVAGALQINARIPRGITASDAMPITISIGDRSSPPVTMAVR